MVKSTTGSGSSPTAKAKTTPQDWTVAPPAVRRAVQLMLAGAAGTFLWGVFWAIVTLAFRSDTVNYYVKAGHVSVSKANAAVNSGVLLVIVQAVLYAAIWVLMARMSRVGQGWARYASTALFLVWTYHTYSAIEALQTYIGLGDLIIELLIWGVGCGALYFLWRPDTTAYLRRPDVSRGRT